MDKEYFSRRIRTQLSHYPSPIDTEQLRKKISKKRQLAARRKKRIQVLYWCAAFSLSALIVCLYGNAGFQPVPVSHPSGCAPTLSHPSLNLQKASPLAPKKTQSPLFDSIDTNAKQLIATALQSPIVPTISKITSTNAKKSAQKNTSQTPPIDTSSTFQNINPSLRNNPISTFPITKTTKKNNISNNASTSRSSNNKPFHSDKQQKLMLLAPLASLNSASLSPLNSTLPLPQWNKLPQPTPQKQTFKKPKVAISLLFATEYTIKKLSGNSLEYIAARQQTESRLEAFSTSLLVHFPLQKNWELSTGFFWQNTLEKLYWENFSTDFIQRDRQFYNQYITRKKTHYNRLSYFDIPLLLTYQKTKNKWNFGLTVGTFFNLRQQAKGEMLDPNLESGHFIQMENGIFKTRIAPSLVNSLQVSYQFHANGVVFLKPEGRFQMGSILRKDFEMSQKYGFLGIGLGVRWSLK